VDLIFLNPAQSKKRVVIQLQWVLVLATSYFVLFKEGQIVQDQGALGLIAFLFISTLVLYRLPLWALEHRLFPHFLAIGDTIMISLGIALSRESPWDIFLIFFFGLFIAAIGESLTKIVVGCLIVSSISVIIHPLSGMNLFRLDPDLLFRIPFIFGVSIVYGYLAEQAKREKEKAERVDQADTLKRQLILALAHDIKNPLGVIMGYAEAMASQFEAEPGGKEKIVPLERIQDNARRIVKLVTGFLDASKAEAGMAQLVRKPIRINHLVREAGQQQMKELAMKDTSIIVDLNDRIPDIMGDEDQIDRVLWNLLGNAIKFTPKGGTITMSSGVEDGWVYVAVKDTGMGIPKDEIPLLFSEFRRLKGSAKVEGTGLGLFIVKTIVEAHGGTVSAESQEGKGSTFTVRFPLKP
jgi:signal transduction histidine kinase